ncbi:DUF262 domain-containing protein [Candidatus Gracilibacteria bacterium]|nr:DUF262 domain-containing protein [Candidatus Gracilibacteria bacterium]
MKNLLNTKTSNLSEILGNGKKYKVPEFQRDYSWSEENWQDLWEDINNIEVENTDHYMGTIVLQNMQENDNYRVVDGQQRLTTMSIIILAIIGFLKELIEKNIDVENNKERIDLLLKGYIGTKDITSLFYTTKLELNKNNNNFYKTYLLEYTKPANTGKLRDSEKLLYEAYIYFKKQISEKFQNDNGEKVSDFFKNIISRRFIFIQIIVDDDISAYTVFETLNARGVELTTTDLLKNYLFSIVSSNGSNVNIEIEETWQHIVDLVGLKDFPNFLRYFINSKNQLVRHERLFKEVKKLVNSPSKVLELLRELEKTAYLYVAIKNPNDDFWNLHTNKKEIQKSLEELKLFGVTQPIPLLFAVYDKLGDIFSDILRYISIISFRYNVIGKLNPNELEKVYNKISQKIYSGELQTKQDIVNMFASIYVNDNDFENIFENKSISTKQGKKIIKYILIKIENYLSQSEYDFEETNITIEHILPENYTTEWKDIFGNEIDNYIYKLGNYTLLKESENRGIGNKNYEEKVGIYKNSPYKITSDKINYDEWNSSTLSKRQKELAKLAKTIWRISL